jgi:hypothetical protein
MSKHQPLQGLACQQARRAQRTLMSRREALCCSLPLFHPCLSATQYLQEGCPVPVCVATYSETHSCLWSAALPSAPTSCKPTLAISEPTAPSVVKEEADTPAPGPSQTANASYNKFDFLMPNTACLAQCWMGKCTLLAQGLEAICHGPVWTVSRGVVYALCGKVGMGSMCHAV